MARVWIDHYDGSIIQGDGVAFSRVPNEGEYVEICAPGTTLSYFRYKVQSVIHFHREVRNVDAIIRVVRDQRTPEKTT